MAERPWQRMIARAAGSETDAPDARTHYARTWHSRALCGWDMLNSPGLPRLVDETEDLPRCQRCEAKRREMGI